MLIYPGRLALGYPTTPSQPSYLVFEVMSAPTFDHCTWNYAALPNKPTAAALGHPFATTLHELLQLELPKMLLNE